MTESELITNLPNCCKIGYVDIEEYEDDVKSGMLKYLPDARTVIVLLHHIENSHEWTWFPFKAERRENTCIADLHAKDILGGIGLRLRESNSDMVLIPYPGTCGLMFKMIALKSNLGSLGDSYLFMNEEWGSWIHLRIALTNNQVQYTRKSINSPCNHCGRCIASCPSGAIAADGFNGNKCADYLTTQRNVHGDNPNIYKCEICARVCPIGVSPRQIGMKYEEL